MRAKDALIVLVLTISGVWLIWDLVNSIVNQFVIKYWSDFCTSWHFPLPFDVYIFGCDTWTVPFDIGLLLIALGFIKLYRAARVF